MANLAYLPCFGDPIYRQMTELCVESLRSGGFSGDIVVFSDGSFTTARNDVTVCDVSHAVEENIKDIRAELELGAMAGQDADASISQWHTSQQKTEDAIRKIAYKASKPGLAALVDHARYERIACMDTDMLAIGNVDALLQVADCGVSAIEERQLGSSMLSESCGKLLLRPGELAKARETAGICTGFVCARSQVLKRSMELWLTAMQADRQRLNYWSDQPHFNVLVLRGQIPFEPLPDTWIDNPPQYALLDTGTFHLRDETKLLHFWWDDKDISLTQMELLSEAIRAGATRRDLDALLRCQLTALREAVVTWLNGRSMPEAIGMGASRTDLYALLRSRLEASR